MKKNLIAGLFLHPAPVRYAARTLIRKLHLGSYKQRLRIGAVERAHYAYCVHNAAILASKLGYERISVLEFGVAGGKGLVNLEKHAQKIQKLLSVNIEVYGFDTGEGLPEPLDYRDIPYHWKKGSYKMDLPKLKAKLKYAKLVLGDIRDTAARFFDEFNPAPVGAAIFDLDFYSSTVTALKMFDADEKYHLPRAYCFFDDLVGTELHLYCDHTGERLAINEFNARNEDRKFEPAYHLLPRQAADPWCHGIRIFHNFRHSRYNDFASVPDQALPLD